VAIHETTIHPFPAQGRSPLTITSEDISRYAELSALVSQLEAQQKALRAELLALRSAGAEQETGSPYLLTFIDQQRHMVDWKVQALALAEMLYGIEKAAKWKVRVEQFAPIQPITHVRVKPNPAYAAGLKKPAASVRLPQTPDPTAQEVHFAD
jgi:hypothetical protein